MKKSEWDFIKVCVINRLSSFMDISDARNVADAVAEEIANDIEETADPERWHNGDVEIALSRLLVKTFCEE